MKEPAWMAGPDDQDHLSPVREHLWVMLEDGGVPQYLIDLVDRVVEQLECQASAECPTCFHKQLEEDARFAKEMQL